MKSKNIIYVSLLVITAGSITACKKFLNPPLKGIYVEDQLTSKKGVNGLLINAYATLDGPEGSISGGASNWEWGSMAGGDAYKGTELADRTDDNPLMRFELSAGNPLLATKWDACYDGIGQANRVLQIMEKATDMSDAEKKQVEAEARFIRGHHHFEAKKMWNNVPYVDETVTDFASATNTTDIWPQIEADLQFAYDNLDEKKPYKGSVNKWAAACFLAKAYMFEKKFAEAKALFTTIIASGKNSQGVAYALTDNYHDNFRVTKENNSETVLAIQASYGDGSTTNANYDNILNYPHGGGSKPGGCCGFFQPSQQLVNAYLTDNITGLPLIDTYNNSAFATDEAVPSSSLWKDTVTYKKDAYVSRYDPAAPETEKVYQSLSDGNKGADPLTSSAKWSLKWQTPSTTSVDPRLDWTVGRRSVPYFDWGNHPGRDWIRDYTYGGPYSPKKNTYYKADEGSTAGKVGWGFSSNALNYTVMRFADVLLMAAEAEIEVGSLSKAVEYINMVRVRAAKFAPSNASPYYTDASAVTYATYKVSPYVSFANQDEARKAVRFERKLELGMEGHRFFDLVRWGIAATELNAYLTTEGVRRKTTLAGATFKAGTHEYFPIPSSVIATIPGIKQNLGY